MVQDVRDFIIQILTGDIIYVRAIVFINNKRANILVLKVKEDKDNVLAEDFENIIYKIANIKVVAFKMEICHVDKINKEGF